MLTAVIDLISHSSYGGNLGAGTESERAGAGVALVFHTAALSMTLILQSLCGAQTQTSTSRDRRPWKEALGSTYESGTLHCEEMKAQLFRLWSSSLFIGAAAMFGVWLTGDVDSIAALILGLMGVVFSMANWIPYALIAIDVSVMHETQRSGMDDAEDFRRDGPQLDHTTAVLVVHNCAICIPQILSSGTASLAFWIMKYCHVKMAVSRIFLGTVPSLLLAAWVSRTSGLRKKPQRLVPVMP